MYILPKNQVRALADALAGDHELYGPVLREPAGEPTFERVDDPAALRIDAAIPYNPPKHAVFPQTERIMSARYDRETRQASVVRDDLVRPKALIGLRACDLTGLLCLDRFFLGQETLADSYYLAREYFDLAAKDSGINGLTKEQINEMRERKLSVALAWKILKDKQIGVFNIPRLIKNLAEELLYNKKRLMLFNGIPELLKELKEEEARLHIISYNQQMVVENTLKKYDCLNFFESIIALDLFHKKEVKMKELIQRSKIKKQELVYIGDEVRDIDLAHKVDIAAIAVFWGFNTKRALRKHKPEYEAHNILGLKDSKCTSCSRKCRSRCRL